MQSQKDEIVIIAPTQIKPHLSLGNIYDLTLADFYTKLRRLNKVKVYMPFLCNINGEPLITQMVNSGLKIDENSINNFIADSISNYKVELKNYYLEFDGFIRDDKIHKELVKLRQGDYKEQFIEDLAYITQCQNCGNTFGSDPLITHCKFCGHQNIGITRKTLYKTVNRHDIQSKIVKAHFVPSSVMAELSNFVDKMPESYKIILEKNRLYTVELNGYKLDPRFTAIILPAILEAKRFSSRTWIHGDVVKKFDYYSFCYLNQEDCPTQIFAHGSLIGEDNKKVRWQVSGSKMVANLNNMDKKILRAYFLRLNPKRDAKLISSEVAGAERSLIKTYVKLNRVLEERNIGEGIAGIRTDLQSYLDAIYHHGIGFNFHLAFDEMVCYVDYCWKLTKKSKVSKEERESLIQLKKLFFGE